MVLQPAKEMFLQLDADRLCCVPCRRGWCGWGAPKSTRSEMAWKDCKGHREAKVGTVLCCLLGLGVTVFLLGSTQCWT